MADRTELLRSQLSRQVWHWTLAAARLADLDELAPREAWRQLEQYLGVTVRKQLAQRRRQSADSTRQDREHIERCEIGAGHCRARSRGSE